MRWLSQHSLGDLGLRSRHLRPLVEDLLQEHFYSRVLYNLKQRKLNGYLHQVTLRCTADLVWKYEIVIPFYIVCLSVDQEYSTHIEMPLLLVNSCKISAFARHLLSSSREGSLLGYTCCDTGHRVLGLHCQFFYIKFIYARIFYLVFNHCL